MGFFLRGRKQFQFHLEKVSCSHVLSKVRFLRRAYDSILRPIQGTDTKAIDSRLSTLKPIKWIDLKQIAQLQAAIQQHVIEWNWGIIMPNERA